MVSLIGSLKVSTLQAKNFVEIAKLFIQARNLIQEGNFTHDQAFLLDEEVRKLHPKNRFLDTGFYDYDPDMVK